MEQNTDTTPDTTTDDDTTLYDGALYKMLVEKLPSAYVKGARLDTGKLCKATGNARYTVYRWLNGDWLSRKAARKLLELSNETEEVEKKGALTQADLVPFVLDF